MRYSLDKEEPGPSHWIIIDPRPPGYIGQEIVDLSPGAIELRQVARQLRSFAEQRQNWIDIAELESDWNRWPGDRPDNIRDLSFGVRVIYGVDYDAETGFFEGKPVRHLAVHGSKRRPTPATVGEITTYFWGRRAAQMRIAASGLAHVVVGMDWEQLDPRQLMRLL
ncbi:MAG: hypothetical protein JSV86_04555 [Gemmatimonadota bacterium]|nr:MAG: hypothetical protein JSV86_04555 [Gemmatimonadota bacterium]